MATKFWLPSAGAAEVAPPFDSSWDKTSGADRLRMVTTKGSSGNANRSTSAFSWSSDLDVLVRQYVSDPIDAQTITGTVEGVLQCREAIAGLDQRAQLVVRVVSNDGTVVRGTLLALDTGSLASEFSDTAEQSRYFPKGSTGATVSSVAAQAGDRIVVEVGYRQHGFGLALLYYAFFGFGWGRMRFGETGSDLPQNETQTTDGAPWIEFSFNIAFQAGGTPEPPPEPPPTSAGGPQYVPRVSVPWQVFLCDVTGSPLLDVTTRCAGKQMTFGLSEPASFRGEIDSRLVSTAQADGLPLLAVRARTVKAYRYEDTNDDGVADAYVIRFAGIVETVQDAGDERSNRTRFTAYDPLHLLGFRFCRDANGGFKVVTFVNEDGAQIARTLVDRANALSATGLITDGGTFEETSARSTKWEAKMVRPALVELSHAYNGFDLAVDPVDDPAALAVMSCYVKRGADRPDVVFAWKQEPATSAAASRVEDGSALANVIVGAGGTQANDAKLYTAEKTDTASIMTYRRSEALATYSDITEADYLDDLADQHLALRKQPKYSHSYLPLPGKAAEPFVDWYLGDTARSRAHADLRGGWDGVQRVFGFSLDLDDDGVETVSGVTLGIDVT